MSQLDLQQQKAQTNGQIIARFEAALTAGSAGPCNPLLLRGSTSTRKRMHAGSCMCSTAPLCMSLVALPGTPGSLSHGDMGHGSIGTASTNNVPLLFLFTLDKNTTRYLLDGSAGSTEHLLSRLCVFPMVRRRIHRTVLHPSQNQSHLISKDVPLVSWFDLYEGEVCLSFTSHCSKKRYAINHTHSSRFHAHSQTRHSPPFPHVFASRTHMPPQPLTNRTKSTVHTCATCHMYAHAAPRNTDGVARPHDLIR
jgi:hypothetical protein